jgi:hypothetical protein
MKRFLPACAAAALLLGGCVTHEQYIDLTGNVLVDGPRMIANGPPHDKLLWEYRTAAAAMHTTNFAMAKEYLDDAITRLGGIYGPDKSAQKSRSYFHEEKEKTFIGEPYERVMAYYYRGILYWMDGELDNARACFRSGEIEDSSSEGQQYSGDYALLDYLDGLATVKQGGDGADAFARAQKEIRFAKPPPYDAKANVLFFVDFGPGVKKYAAGRYKEQLRFAVPVSPVSSAVISMTDRTVPAGNYDDLGFQATTRGGRVMDYVLANKAVFKTGTAVAGEVGILGGLIAADSRNQTSQEVGAGLIAAGLISEVISASVTPAADTRAWDNLPRYLGFAAIELPPGPHQATVQFLDANGRALPNLTKTVSFTVPADNHDKVVYVSDRSYTPQTQ